jgi:hypothetical protein
MTLVLTHHFFSFPILLTRRNGFDVIAECVALAAVVVGRAWVLLRVAIRLPTSQREPRMAFDSLDWPTWVLGGRRGCQVLAGATSPRVEPLGARVLELG